MRLQQYIGDDDEHDFPLTWKGAAFDPTGCHLIFTAKFRSSDPDILGAFQHDTGRGVTFSGTTARVKILRADTINLDPCTLDCDIQAKTSAGEYRTVAAQKIQLKRDITRGGVVSLPINVEPIDAFLTIVRNRHTGNWESIYLDMIDGDLVLQSEVVFPSSNPNPAIILNRNLNRYETLFIDEINGQDVIQSEVFGSELPEYPTASLAIDRSTGQAHKIFIDSIDGEDTLQTEILTP